MTLEGPPLALLTQHLAELPVDFMAEPARTDNGGVTEGVHVDAVVYDVLERLHYTPLQPEALEPFRSQQATERNRLRLTLLCAWLLTCDALEPHARPPAKPLLFLTEGLGELASYVDATKFVTEPERREELCRRLLKGLDRRPAGESQAQAEDRMAAVDSEARARVLMEAQKADARAAKIRKELQAKAAQEAAAKISRE